MELLVLMWTLSAAVLAKGTPLVGGAADVEMLCCSLTSECTWHTGSNTSKEDREEDCSSLPPEADATWM